MISNQVFKIGTAIKGDITCLKKQFPQLTGKSITTIDLKDYAIQHGIIHHKEMGSLDALVEKTLGKYLLKDDMFQKNTPAGSRVALSIQEGGNIVAYGKIAANQVAPFKGVCVKVPNQNQLLQYFMSITQPSVHQPLQKDSDSDDSNDESEDTLPQENVTMDHSENLILQMLKASHAMRNTLQGLSDPPVLELFHNTVQSLPDTQPEYQTVKKDTFHAFQMIPTPQDHGMQPTFLYETHNHLLRWDPLSHESMDKACWKFFNLSFDEMLLQNPHFIQERTPHYVPQPSVLVPSLLHVFETLEKSLDAKTGAPLFSKKSWTKAFAVLDLAREGYLSDNKDIMLYEKAGIDQFGLQKWRYLQGTNKVERGPHSDIYHKFSALHSNDFMFTIIAYAQHICGVDWNYHHDLGMLNRISFLLNYLSDIVHGASFYSDWINRDLYERTDEQFGICLLPESLRVFTLDFFSQIHVFSTQAGGEGKGKINYEVFAQEWNYTANGKD
ncbi:hypothetical protein ARMGADRAFT_1030892 [Armillaria gallica]|uniref:Uncharacterized protein n=1 Tax=Armillaria gallica TaxID=47427 RepID=A0A2H3DYX6_ARMGA|nr:hypothetical protein ARMGADRAFT_1030892 [Armillaria gallica]